MRALSRSFAAVVMAIGLAGCATGRVVVAPDGQAALYVACRNPWNCQHKAERLCYAGYQIVSGGPQYWLIRCAQYPY